MWIGGANCLSSSTADMPSSSTADMSFFDRPGFHRVCFSHVIPRASVNINYRSSHCSIEYYCINMVLHKSINIDHFVAIIVKEFLLSPFSITQCR